jgi:hypothetical protein
MAGGNSFTSSPDGPISPRVYAELGRLMADPRRIERAELPTILNLRQPQRRHRAFSIKRDGGRNSSRRRPQDRDPLDPV